MSIDGGGTKILYTINLIKKNFDNFDKIDTFYGTSSGAFLSSLIAC